MLLKDVLKLDVFRDSKILAGKDGLNNEVDKVTVLEVTSEEAVKWIKGGELFLTCLYAISHDIDQQIKVFRFLHSRKASGVIIFSIGYFLPEVSMKLIAEADAIGLPLIVMPAEASYEEVLSPLMSTLLDIRNNDLSVALRVQRTMNLMVLRNEGIRALMHLLMDVLRKPIVFFDNENRCIDSSGHKEIPQSFYQIPEGDDSPVMMYDNRCLRYAVIAYSCYYGSIVVFDVDSAEIERLQLILSNAVFPLALANIRKTSILSKNELEVNNFFTNLVNGRFKSIDEMFEHAQMIRVNLHDFHLVMIIQFANARGKDYLREVKHIVSLDNRQNELFPVDNSLVLLLYSGSGQDADERVIKLCRAIQDLLEKKAVAHMGISNFYETAAELENAYRQALQAVKIGKWLYLYKDKGLRGIFFFRDLSAFAMLYQHYDLVRDGTGVRRDIQKLREQDDIHGSRYAETLRTLSLSNDNSGTTANSMYVHKNTLLYRKNKIVELLGHDPFSMPLKFNYQAYFIAEKLLTLE
jgi:purine catabolism regulator